MIDLHCHILPGLDDGPPDLAHSVEMAQQADRDSIGIVCATPHIRHDHDVRISELPGRVEELNDALRKAGCSTIVTTGGEVAETIVEQLSDDDLSAVSLGGGGRWILLEPKPGPLSETLDHAVVTLRQRGFRSLIAHPERHLCSDMLARLARLTREGALIQATAATMCEPPAAKGMQMLAEAGVIHVLASDAHHPRFGREVTISDGLAAMTQIDLMVGHVAWVGHEAPAAIVAGADIDPPYWPPEELLSF